MSPTPPTVLLDRSFIAALTDRTHPEHGRIAACYTDLLVEYERHRIRLRARADLFDRSDPLFAPVERIHVAAQHRRAALRLLEQLGIEAFSVDEDHAITLVLMRREQITRLATIDPAFDDFDLTLLPAA